MRFKYEIVSTTAEAISPQLLQKLYDSIPANLESTEEAFPSYYMAMAS
jgi:hypothetical protein